MKSYVTLGFSIVLEVFATSMLKFSNGFTILLPSIFVVAGYALSFYSLSLCLRKIPLSLAYAIWSGVGTALTSLVGILVWNEFFNSLSIFGIFLIVWGVIFLHSSDSSQTAKEPSN